MMRKELSQKIRKVLKEAGYNSKSISTRVKKCGYSTRVDVTIKNPEIRRMEIENLLRRFEEIDRDEITGEILMGGNTYIFVEYASGIFDEAAQEWAATARGVMDSKEEITRIFDGLYVVRCGRSGDLAILQQDNREHCRFRFYNFSELCVFIYKFAKFGTIAA